MEKNRLQMSFGLRCRQLRDQTGLSQERFALSIGMDRSYYASIETGTRNVTLLNMAKIAGGFGVSLSELLKEVSTEDSCRGRNDLADPPRRVPAAQ